MKGWCERARACELRPLPPPSLQEIKGVKL